MDFSRLNFGVDGDSITAGEQWSYHVYKELGMASHHNVAVAAPLGISALSRTAAEALPLRIILLPILLASATAGRKLTTLLSFRREPTTALSFIPSALLKR